MSDDFGKNVRNKAYQVITEDESKEMFPDVAHLANPQYNRLIRDYFGCVSKYMQDFYDPKLMEQQLNRRDLDTVCAYELYQMKKEFTTSNVLNMSQFVQKN